MVGVLLSSRVRSAYVEGSTRKERSKMLRRTRTVLRFRSTVLGEGTRLVLARNTTEKDRETRRAIPFSPLVVLPNGCVSTKTPSNLKSMTEFGTGIIIERNKKKQS